MARVLVIEDNPDVRDSLIEVLQIEGYVVRRAPEGAAGLVQARVFRPHVILLDLMMPVMDGWTFRAEQMRDDTIADIPVVVVSAFSGTKPIDAAQFLKKPCRIEALVQAVERHRLRSNDDAPSP